MVETTKKKEQSLQGNKGRRGARIHSGPEARSYVGLKLTVTIFHYTVPTGLHSSKRLQVTSN